MENQVSAGSAGPSRAERIFAWVAVACVLIGFAFMQVRQFRPGYTEPDPDGYIVMAKRIARGEPIAQPNDDPFRYQTHVWVENERGEVLAKFAPGYPLLMAGGYLLFGDEGVFLVSPVMAILGLLGMFVLARQWMSPTAAFFATLALALTGSYLFYSGYLLTHMTELCVVVWAMVFLWRWLREPNWWAGLLAGLLLGAATSVRYTAVLFAAVMCIALIATWLDVVRRHRRAPWLSTLLMLAGYAVVPLLLAWYNHAHFGSMWITGYGLSDEQDAFTLENFFAHYQLLNRGLSYELIYLATPLAIVAIAAIGAVRERLMRAIWILPTYVVYAAYYWTSPSNAYYRFLFAAVPCIIAAAFMLIDRIDVRRRNHVIAMVAVVVLIALNGWDHWRNLYYGEAYLGARQGVTAARHASELLEPDAVIFAQRPSTWKV